MIQETETEIAGIVIHRGTMVRLHHLHPVIEVAEIVIEIETVGTVLEKTETEIETEAIEIVIVIVVATDQNVLIEEIALVDLQIVIAGNGETSLTIAPHALSVERHRLLRVRPSDLSLPTVGMYLQMDTNI